MRGMTETKKNKTKNQTFTFNFLDVEKGYENV